MRPLILALALSLPFSLPARAEVPAPPTEAEVKGWSAIEYNDHLVEVHNTTIHRIVARLNNGFQEDDPAAFQQWVDDIRAVTHEARTQCALLPPYKGDAGLRDALVAGYDSILSTYKNEVMELRGIVMAERVTAADVARAEEIFRISDARAKEIDQRIDEAQKAFADRHRLLIQKTEQPVIEEQPEFTAPGFPPSGTPLTGTILVGLSITYHNQLMRRHDELIQALNRFLEATNGPADKLGEVHASTQTRFKATREAIALEEPWAGDASLRDAVLAEADAYIALLDGPFGEYTAILGKGRLKQKQADQVNALAREGNEAIKARGEMVDAAFAEFRRVHHIEAFEAWVQAQAAGIP